MIEAAMAKKTDSTTPKPIQIAMDAPDTSDLRVVGGSRSDRFNNALITAMVQTGWFPAGQSEDGAPHGHSVAAYPEPRWTVIYGPEPGTWCRACHGLRW
jgi:hypothetical protein